MTIQTPFPASPTDRLAQLEASGQAAVSGLESGRGKEVSSGRHSVTHPALIVLAVIGLVAALYFARGFFVPLLIGILASYTLRPMVGWLQAMRIPRAIAAAVVLGVLVGGVSWVGYSLSDEASVMLEKLPEAVRKLRRNLSPTRNAAPTVLQNVQEAADELQGVATDATRKPGLPVQPAPVATSWLSDYARTQSALLMTVLAQAPIVILLTYFLLASGDHFRRKLLQVVGPSLTRKKDALRILDEIDVQVQRFLLVTFVSNTLVGICTWLVFWAMGIEQSGLWGVAAGVLHFIPYLGPVAVAAAAGVAGFLLQGTVWYALTLAGVSILVAGLVGLVLTTWLQSRYAKVNAAVLFIALLFFGWLWGVAGLLLGAPLIAIVKVICDRVDYLRPTGEWLGR